MDEAEFARRRDTTQHLIAVNSHSSWPIVRELFKARQQKELKDFFKNIPMAQGDVDYKRGFGAGLEYVIETIDNAEAAFAALVERRKKEAGQVG